MELTVGEIAERLGGVCEGDANVMVTSVAGIREALPGEITFLSETRYASYLNATRAEAVVVETGFDRSAVTYEGAFIRVESPIDAFQELATWFAGAPVELPVGIHPAACVSPEAELGDGVGVGAGAVIEAGACIGAGTRIWPNCFIGTNVRIGRDSVLYPQVSIREHCVVGDRFIAHGGAVIGSDGFGYTVGERGVRAKIPQVGIVWIGDDVEIGANATVDRARFGKTRIGNGAKIDNLVQIAHNVVIGENSVVVAQAGIAGSTVIGDRAILGGQVGVGGHLVIGTGAILGAQGGVTKDVPPGIFVSGYPAAPHRKAAEIQANINRLPKLKKRVSDLEARLAELESRLGAAPV